jgi:hypothetical protein
MAANDPLPADCITPHLCIHVAQHDDHVVGGDPRQRGFKLLVKAVLSRISRGVCGRICHYNSGVDGAGKVEQQKAVIDGNIAIERPCCGRVH